METDAVNITRKQIVSAVLAIQQNKAEATNLVTQKLIEDRIADLHRQMAAEPDAAERAKIADRIEQYKEKLRALEAQLLK